MRYVIPENNEVACRMLPGTGSFTATNKMPAGTYINIGMGANIVLVNASAANPHDYRNDYYYPKASRIEHYATERLAHAA